MQEKSIKNRIEIHFPIFISKNERFQMSFYIHLCWRKPCFDSSLVAICRDLIQSSLNVFVSFIDRDSDGLWRNIIYCFMLVFCVGRTIVIVCCVHPFLSHSLSFPRISQLIRARNDRKCCLLVVADIHCSVCFILVVLVAVRAENTQAHQQRTAVVTEKNIWNKRSWVHNYFGLASTAFRTKKQSIHTKLRLLQEINKPHEHFSLFL